MLRNHAPYVCTAPATAQIYTLSLHAAVPIYKDARGDSSSTGEGVLEGGREGGEGEREGRERGREGEEGGREGSIKY